MLPMTESRRLGRFWIPLWMILSAASPASSPAAPGAAPLPGGLEPGGVGKVVEVIDGDTVVLEDGRQVRLVGIQAPKLPLGRSGFKAWPLSGEAKAVVESLVLGRTVELGYGGQRMDRHGRALAHLATHPGDFGAGRWLQGELLRQGLARTYSFADNRTLVAEMLRLEEDARRAGLGIWSRPYYAVRTAERLHDDIGSFQLVTGRVLQVATVRGRVYFNFGEDWKTDFTVTLDPKTRRRFESEGIEAVAYQGRTVRVRGWLKSFNGPMIEVTHPEQIELVP